MRVVRRLNHLLKNICVSLFTIFVKRDDQVVLVGAWMGEKFADNSRFLFQYLSENMECWKIRKVIWATRSKEVIEVLDEMGYSSVLIGTKESFYWHCKAGIHIICNMYDDGSNYDSDIDSSLSAGAKKVQLWHGNGIKCVPGIRRPHNKIISFIRRITSPGCWDIGNYYLLCKCDLDYSFFSSKFDALPSECIDGAYPRSCRCLRYTKEEKTVLQMLEKYDKIILYLPTFRKKYDSFVHPLTNEGILRYLNKNNIVWIEKPHAADKNSASVVNKDYPNVISLDSTFDINVLMPKIDILITDYSSAMLDALFFKKQIVYYVPDYDYYIKDDRGFLIDYDSVCINDKVLSIDQLLSAITLCMSKTKYGEKELKIRKMFWKHDDWNYEDIWNSIIETVCNAK